jgi:succinylglutamate desuccinylase
MEAVRLTRLGALPDGFLDSKPESLHALLPGPALIHLEGRERAPLFVSALLHGNETTSFFAVQALLQHYRGGDLPRSLSIFIGNVAAARDGLRRLDGQPDYNRVWPGMTGPASPESALMRAVVDEMAGRGVFASVDIHNNTGFNPHYACVNRLEDRFLHLAAMFSRLVVYFTQPKGVQSGAFAPLCPAVTVECGKPGQEYGIEHAREFLDACLHLHAIPGHPLPPRDVDLYHTIAQVTLRDEVDFSFEDDSADIVFISDLDRLNFTELPVGTVIGRIAGQKSLLPVRALNESGEEVTQEYFAVKGGNLVLNRSVMPSMLTLNERIIRQDCLCYLMERIAR